jgi:hypothetical protein
MEMNPTLLRRAFAFATLVTALTIGSFTLHAIDSNNRYFAYGVGQRSCEDYIKFREKKLDALQQQHERYTTDELYEIVDRIVEHWIAGFLTAHNLYMTDTYDVAGKSNMNDIKARLEKTCRANHKQRFAEAVITVVHELNPQRVKAGGSK